MKILMFGMFLLYSTVSVAEEKTLLDNPFMMDGKMIYSLDGLPQCICEQRDKDIKEDVKKKKNPK